MLLKRHGNFKPGSLPEGLGEMIWFQDFGVKTLQDHEKVQTQSVAPFFYLGVHG